MPRPSSATGNYYDTKDAEIVGQGSTSTEKESWLKKSFIGRTPSLPSTLGKKKSFFKVKKKTIRSYCRSVADCLLHKNERSNRRSRSVTELMSHLISVLMLLLFCRKKFRKVPVYVNDSGFTCTNGEK